MSVLGVERTSRWRRIGAAACGVAVTITSMVVLPPSAYASCPTQINGEPAGQRSVVVDSHGTLHVSGVAAPNSVTRVFFEVYGVTHQVRRVVAGKDGGWSANIPVRSYTRWAVGSIGIHSETEAASGACADTAYVTIHGSLVTSRLFWAGSVIGLVGVFGLLLLLIRGVRSVLRIMFSRGREPRDISLSTTAGLIVLGSVFGLLASGGALALLQETATRAPTFGLALEVAVAFALLGAITGALSAAR